MEKLIYLLEPPGSPQDVLQFAEAELLDRVSGLRVQVDDEAVRPGANLRQQNAPSLPTAVVSFWLDTAQERGPIEAKLKDFSPDLAGYLVSESSPIRQELSP